MTERRFLALYYHLKITFMYLIYIAGTPLEWQLKIRTWYLYFLIILFVFFQFNVSNIFTDPNPISFISKSENASAVYNTNNENEMLLTKSPKHLRAFNKSKYEKQQSKLDLKSRNKNLVDSMPKLNILIKRGTSLIVVIYNRYFYKEWQG